MDYHESLWTVAAIMSMALVSPGPNFVVVTATAASVSRAAGLMSAIGIGAATLTWTLLAVSSLQLLALTGPLVYAVLRAAGAAYLAWLGVALLRNARKPFDPNAAGTASRGAWAAMGRGYLVSMTNPKAAAFFGSIFAIALPRQAPAWVYAASIAIAVGLSLSWNCSLALFFSNARVADCYVRAKWSINTAMGLLLIGVAARMALGA